MKFNYSNVFAAMRQCSLCPLGELLNNKAVCNYDQKEIEFFNAEYACPKGLWKSDLVDKQNYINLNPEPSAWTKVKSFWQTTTSGQATEETIKLRNESCNTCPKLVRKSDKRYCGACGCGEWKLSELDTKLSFKVLPCPLNRPGFNPL